MGKVTSYLYEHESKSARQREDAARSGKTAYGAAAERFARIVGTELSEEERKRYGSAVHWALGITAGALYGALRMSSGPACVARARLAASRCPS